MHQQHWQNQAHPNARYPPAQYANQYPVQNAPKPPPVFKSQSELGFQLPPVRPQVAIPVQPQPQPQRRPMSMGPPPVPSQMQARSRPQSMGYPNPGFAPPVHMNQAGGLPPQLARSSSASPTRKPLPAPTRPQTVTQSSGFAPLPANRTQSVDLSAFSRFNQERMASGAISSGAVRNSSPVKAYPGTYAPHHPQQQQQQSSMIMMNNRAPSSSFTSPPIQPRSSPHSPYSVDMTAAPRRRTSPPRFFGNTSTSSSRNNSPEKASSTFTPTNAQSFYPRNPPSAQPPLPRTVPLQSRPKYDANPSPPSASSLQSAAPSSSSTFATASSAAIRHRNPIFEPQDSVPPTEKFVPLWKRSSITRTGGGNFMEVEKGRSVNVPATTTGRPLPQPNPSRFSTQYTVEEPEDDGANRSFESISESSAVSVAPSATSANSQMSGANNGPGILDLRSSLPQPPNMNRGAASTGALAQRGSRFDERQAPQPPGMDRSGATTGAIHEAGAGSMTLRFAKMGLDATGNGSAWPQDLPPLPRGPGSGFSNGKSFSRPSSSHSQSSSSSRHAHSLSQPQSQSVFASSNGGSRGRNERVGFDYDLDEPPPRPASASFSARSASPAGSTASSTTGALERFRRNTQPQAQPQPQYPSHVGQMADGYSGHAMVGVKIESPSPLGGKEKMADVRRMENDSNKNSGFGGALRTSGNRDNTYDRRDKPEVPKITFGDDGAEDAPSGPMIRVSGEGPEIPRITFEDDDDDDGSPPGPMIRVSAEEEPKPKPPQIVFEVPGVGVRSHFGSAGMGPEDHDTPRRGGPRALPSAHSSFDTGSNQMPGRRGGLTCPACGKTIVGRIVGAMGMKWHPDCFRCTVCDELLEFQSSYEGVGEDGIKRPYCHLDYHETFAPKCYHCKTAIVEERFISLNDPALGRRTYHETHFFCAECGDPFLSPSSAASHNRERDLGRGAGGELSFSGDGTFSYDDEDDNVGFTVYRGHPYCEACHVRLRLPKCKRCKRPIRDHTEAVEALGGKWCWECFRCTNCDKPFDDPSFFERDKKPYCENCFSVIIRNEI